MTDDWFRVPETGAGTKTDPLRPDLHGYDVDGWAGKKQHPNGSPKWVVRVYGDESTLSALGDESGVQRLDNIPVQALNQMLGEDRSREEWARAFRAGE